MKLAGINCQIPSNKIYNEDIIELVKYHSSSQYDGNIKELETIVRRFLFLTGSETRFWRQGKEKPVDFIIQSVDKALLMANLQKKDIDMLIYSSIDRGFMEPANASIISKIIGLEKVRSFDISDACMGWASAVQVANSFLSSSPDIKNILVINSEFPMDKKGAVLPNNFTIKNKSELNWKSASFTLGEASSASIFQKDNCNNFQFEYIENSNCSQSCVIPLFNFEKYQIENSQNSFLNEMQFFADGAALLANGMKPAVQVLNNLLSKVQYEPTIIFPHAVSNKVIQDAASSVQLNALIYSTFPQLGNLATASIPSSISKAFQNAVIKKNEKIVAWIASAGMKFVAFEIQL